MKITEKINLDMQGLIENGPITIVAFGDSVTHGAVAAGEINYETVYWNRLKKKINEISKLLKLDSMLKENPTELSGGEKQKLALACALMLEPRILVLDEALMMIDINEKKELLKIIKDYNQKKRVTVVCLTHDLEEALYSDRIIVLNEGKIVKDYEKGKYYEVV